MSDPVKVYVIRSVYEDKQVLGNLFLIRDTDVVFTCKTLELAWRDNAAGNSCIPVGIYPIVFEYSPSFKTYLWELKQVSNRSEVKIHSANYFRQLQGCIALGKKHTDIDGDGFRDVISSRDTLERFHYHLRDQTKTTITIIGDGRDNKNIVTVH